MFLGSLPYAFLDAGRSGVAEVLWAQGHCSKWVLVRGGIVRGKMRLSEEMDPAVPGRSATGVAAALVAQRRMRSGWHPLLPYLNDALSPVGRARCHPRRRGFLQAHRKSQRPAWRNGGDRRLQSLRCNSGASLHGNVSACYGMRVVYVDSKCDILEEPDGKLRDTYVYPR